MKERQVCGTVHPTSVVLKTNSKLVVNVVASPSDRQSSDTAGGLFSLEGDTEQLICPTT